jgi:hypothetical protein
VPHDNRETRQIAPGSIEGKRAYFVPYRLMRGNKKPGLAGVLLWGSGWGTRIRT